MNIHKRQISKNQQGGYTLLELLVYVAIVGALLTTVTYFFGTTVDARVKNQTIVEVNDQGRAIMDAMTQTIHNATSITAPTAGTSATSLTLAVPTGSLSPTVFSIPGGGGGTSILGINVDGGSTDSGSASSIDGDKFVAAASGTISSLNALIGASVGTSPNNQMQMAIYSGTTQPTTLLASSASVAVTANTWMNFPIATVTVTSGQTYWLAYSSNGLTSSVNNVRYQIGSAGQEIFAGIAFGTWPPGVWPGSNVGNFAHSEYAVITTAGGASTGVIQITEGAGAAVPLTDNEVTLSALTFTNLTRASTPGIVQISFTLSRLNPSNRNEYDYQKTFTGTAEVGW